MEEEIKKIDLQEDQADDLKKPFWRSKTFYFLVAFFLIIVLLVASIAIPGYFVLQKAKNTNNSLQALKDSVKSRDLKLINDNIASSRKALSELESSMRLLFWIGYLPVIGDYEKDAVHLIKAGELGLETGEIVIKSVEPYADILGFTGGQMATSGEKTAEDRINFIAATLDKIGPDLDKIGDKSRKLQKELSQINPDKYPENFRDQKIRAPLKQAIELANEVATLTNDAKPLLANSPWLLGNDSPRKYLVLFQNDGELRPAGGFITAYAFLEVNKGKIKPMSSEDIYSLDASYKPQLKAPDALVKYVKLPYGTDPRWRLRDMNLSPDFSSSMQIFSEQFSKTSKTDFDVIVAVDTKFLTKLLRVLGTVGVFGWGNFSAEPEPKCYGCPQAIYQLENIITRPVNTLKTERKAVLGPLMYSILANVFGSPKERMPSLFEAFFTSIQEKHVVFYTKDEKIEKALESFNLAGRLKPYDGDYFHLNDSNFSGAKVNMFIKQQIEQKIEIAKDGTVTKAVTVTYKNPAPASDCNLERGGLCLNAPYRDWVRLYVPQGSTLIESSGLEDEVNTYEELGKTVFDGFFGDQYPLRPEGQAKISFKYKLPFKITDGDYRLLIQKQIGVSSFPYTLDVNGKTFEYELAGDREIKIKI